MRPRYPIGLTLILLTGGVSAFAGTSNSLMDVSTDGRFLACANRDSGTVTIIELESFTKTAEIEVGKHPEGISFVGDSLQLAVAVYDEDRVVFVDAGTGEVVGDVEVFDEPYGVVSDAAGESVYVTLDYPGEVVEIDVATRSVLRRLDAGRFVRGVALSEPAGRLLITEFYSGIVRAIDLESGSVVDEWIGTSADNLSRQITLHPQRPKAYLPHIRSAITVAHGAGSIFPYVSIIDTEQDEGRRRKRIPMDAFSAGVTSNPWEVAVSPTGDRLYVLFSGTDDMFACNVLDDNYRELAPDRTVRLGRNPRAVRVSTDGSTFYVYNALDFEVVAYEAERCERIAAISVCENPLNEQILTGKRLFYSAQQPMVGRRWISCSSCHPDGQPDGRTWHNPEGLRNTQALAGMAWTHPIHWSADRDEVQDFEHTIRGPLMQGRGLISGPVQPALETPNRGLSAELDALAAYSNTHTISLSPHAKNGLSESARRGRELFQSAEIGCMECHSGPFLTDSRPDQEILRHDVGTGRADAGELMGYAYDTPTLHGLYRTAPYLHDGSAPTLADVLTTQNSEDEHGRTSHLNQNQIQDLVEYLMALPYEDPVALAREAGLPQVVD